MAENQQAVADAPKTEGKQRSRKRASASRSQSSRSGGSRRTSAARRSTSQSASNRRRPTKSSSRGSSRRSSGNGRGMTSGIKNAVSGAYDWAGEAGSAIPRAMRGMHMPKIPSQRSIQSFADEKPLMLAAVGLGIGVLIGAMLPNMQGSSQSRRSR